MKEVSTRGRQAYGVQVGVYKKHYMELQALFETSKGQDKAFRKKTDYKCQTASHIKVCTEETQRAVTAP